MISNPIWTVSPVAFIQIKQNENSRILDPFCVLKHVEMTFMAIKGGINNA